MSSEFEPHYIITVLEKNQYFQSKEQAAKQALMQKTQELLG